MRGYTNRSLQPRTKAIVLVVYITGGMLGGMPTIHMIVLKDICFRLNALFARAKFGRLTPKTMISRHYCLDPDQRRKGSA
jgi:hypothetical protein